MRSTALAICGKASRTEAATLASSRLMMPTRSSVDSRSRRVEARLRCSGAEMAEYGPGMRHWLHRRIRLSLTAS